MLLQLKFANKNDLTKIAAFYQNICQQQKYDQYGPNWHWGIYPSEKGLAQKIDQGQLFIGLLDKQIASAGFITFSEGTDYQNIKWLNPVKNNEVAILHLFAVDKAFRGQGIASKMLLLIKDYCQKQGIKAIHLDVLKGNLAAENLYKKSGFKFVTEKKLNYQDLGPTSARIFEWCLN